MIPSEKTRARMYSRHPCSIKVSWEVDNSHIDREQSTLKCNERTKSHINFETERDSFSKRHFTSRPYRTSYDFVTAAENPHANLRLRKVSRRIRHSTVKPSNIYIYVMSIAPPTHCLFCHSHTRERSQKKPRHSQTKSRSSDKSLPPENTTAVGSLL